MLNPTPWVVHKFGGSSVADADCFRKVAAILDSAPAARLGVVLSACRGVTDALLRLVALAERQDEAYHGEVAQLRTRHAGIAEELLAAAVGRRGRAFSASLVGAQLGASEARTWTDVDGMLSGDPRRVPGATVIGSLSSSEAMGLAYFGAKVLHPQTMAPAVKDGIPIWIRTTFAPDRAGTPICALPSSPPAVKGITSIDRVALINLEC